MLTVFLLLMIIEPILPCHSFNNQPQYLTRARARGATSMDSFDRSLIDLDYSTDLKCTTSPPYSSNDIRAVSSISPFPEIPPLVLADGGKMTCSFDNEMEYCSWHNAMDTVIKFWKAGFDRNFEMDRFDCTNIRRFPVDRNFLLAGGEPSISLQTAAVETEIPCQFGDAVVQFDFWANTANPLVRFCIIGSNGADLGCEDILPMPNPVNFTVKMTPEPIKVRIEVVNLGTDDIVLIDNLYYNGQICELVEEESFETTTEIQLLSPTAATLPLLITGTPQVPEEHVQKFFEENEIEENNEMIGGVSIFGIKKSIQLSSTTYIPLITAPLSPDSTSDFNELSPCTALTCDFNDDDSCFYGLSGVGSSEPWLLSNQLVGNRHTGIQRVDVDDQKKVGFVYVGGDFTSTADQIFVMESPKFTITEDVMLIFDVYLRSHAPTLKVCVDSFDDCPYSSPGLDKREYWHFSHKVPLKIGSTKVLFVAQNVANHQFLAIDNIRLQTSDGLSYCDH